MINATHTPTSCNAARYSLGWNQQTQSRFQRAFSHFNTKKMPKENPTLSDEADSTTHMRMS